MGKTFFHWLMCWLGLHQPHTQTTEAERQAIAKYAKGKRLAVEIGVFEGRTTAVIASCITENGKVFAIDPFFSGRLGISYGKLISRQYLNRQSLISKVQFLKMLSWEAAPLIREEIEFLFVDGDHSYEGIHKDWQDWSVKIKPGGIVALHDTCVIPGREDATIMGSHEYFNKIIRLDHRFIILEQVDSLSILQKTDE